MLARPQADLELKRIAAPAWATPGARVYALLPTLETLVGQPGFGARSPIRVAPARPAFNPWAFFQGASVH
jgi:hypothetical protein